MRIVYIIETLAQRGGVERILSEKANFFADNYGYDVTFVVCYQKPGLSNAFPLSNTVKQIYLNIPYYSQYSHKYPLRLWFKRALNKKLQKKLTECIHSLNPDIIIGVSHFRANMICSINCNAKKIIESHEPQYLTLSGLTQHQNIISRFFLKIYRNRYLKTIEKKADIVVTLTKGDEMLWSKAKRTEVIPNFSTIKVLKTSSCDSKRIIAVGRLSWEKGYDRLIDIWEQVVKEAQDWHLDIYGDGELRGTLLNKITQRSIKNIAIHPTTNNISQEYSKSSILVMTSFLEGFPLVLVEALKHGIPCIAFDCPFGPARIISDEKCGYIIENGNIDLYTNKLRLLMNDEKMRRDFSKESIKHAELFAVEPIMEKWNSLIKCL